jgi:hypothetical protein
MGLINLTDLSIEVVLKAHAEVDVPTFSSRIDIIRLAFLDPVPLY